MDHLSCVMYVCIVDDLNKSMVLYNAVSSPLDLVRVALSREKRSFIFYGEM